MRFRAVFKLPSRSEGWEKIGNISLVSCSQIFEEARILQDPSSQVSNKTPKIINRARI